MVLVPENLQNPSLSARLERLYELPLSDIQGLCESYATRIHHIFLKEQVGFKLILNDGMAPGGTSSLLAQHNGSSRYLLGSPPIFYSGFDAFSEVQTPREYAEAKTGEIVEFCQRAGVDESLVMAGLEGFASGERAGQLMAYSKSGDRMEVENLNLNLPSDSEDREKIQALGSIAVFEQILTLLDKNDEREDVRFLVEAKILKGLNAGLWEKLEPRLRELNLRVSLGESFTAGYVAKLMTSHKGASEILHRSTIWYDKRFKAHFGVEEELLTDENIVKPQTMAKASRGVLEAFKDLSSLAIGTSGYANFWQREKSDHFSVCLSRKQEDGFVSTQTAYVEVTSSIGGPNYQESIGRRELTRQLGVTTALYLLISSLSEQVEGFQGLASELQQLIQSYSTMELRNDW